MLKAQREENLWDSIIPPRLVMQDIDVKIDECLQDGERVGDEELAQTSS